MSWSVSAPELFFLNSYCTSCFILAGFLPVGCLPPVLSVTCLSRVLCIVIRSSLIAGLCLTLFCMGVPVSVFSRSLGLYYHFFPKTRYFLFICLSPHHQQLACILMGWLNYFNPSTILRVWSVGMVPVCTFHQCKKKKKWTNEWSAIGIRIAIQISNRQ